MEAKINKIKNEAIKLVAEAKDENSLREIEVRFLGRKGELTLILRGVAGLPQEERPKIGKLSNEIKQQIESAIKEKRGALENQKLSKLSESEWLDVTLPIKSKRPIGKLHPITQIRYEMEKVFSKMGFYILDGPEVETDFYNFEGLNFPKHHPARDIQDTLWLSDGNLMRTHTSPVQIRAMKSIKPPLKAIVPGRVFRHEATDASHDNTFHQVEGFMIDKKVSVADLIYSMTVFVKTIIGEKSKFRFRPGFFPFVEPGFEMDISCIICGGKGCSVCKKTGWIEMLGCGLIHPNVMKSGGLDPDKWKGFAFGLGLDRFIMIKYGINDIRHFMSGDLRFLNQF